LVTGPSGCGKSRLLLEFLGLASLRAKRAVVFTARADPVATRTPLVLAADLVRAALEGAETRAERRAALRRRLEGSVSGVDVDRFSDPLSRLLEQGSIGGASLDARFIADRLRNAWLEWLEAEVKRSPVVLILEDIQWADLASIDCVLQAHRQFGEAALVILIT